MALKVEQRGQVTTTANINNKPSLCHTCKVRKEGLFTTDAYGSPMCADCARKANRSLD